MNKTFMILILIGVSLEVVADILFKYWTINSKTYLVVGGVALYAIGTVLWAFSLKYEILSKAVVIFTVLNLVIVILASFIIFKEDVSLINKIGILVGLTGIFLMSI